MKLLNSIPSLQGASLIKPITDGYSSDNKYLVIKDDEKYLLRTFDPKLLKNREKEFSALSKMAELGVRSPKPIELALTPDETLAYLLLSYIDGEDGAKSISQYSAKEQYKIGLDAGEELKRLTQYEAPKEVSPWHERKLAKHLRYLEKYKAGKVRIRNDQKFLKFISQNIHLMKDRPNLFQHDDFHLSNLIIKDGSLAGVIDFGRCDWGDPHHEFLKLGYFSSEYSVPFSIGQLKGYFEGKDPDEEFWVLHSLYSAMSFISFVIWTENVCPEEMGRTLEIIERVLGDHDDFEKIKPKWYSDFHL